MPTDELPVLDVDLTRHDLYRNGFPYQRFAELRRRHSVWWHPPAYLPRRPDGIEFWVVLGHPELLEVSRDWKTFSSLDGASISPTGDVQRGHTLVSSDPPGHTRMRRLISAGFTPRMIRRLDERISERTTQVLDAAAERGTCNFVREVAYQLPDARHRRHHGHPRSRPSRRVPLDRHHHGRPGPGDGDLRRGAARRRDRPLQVRRAPRRGEAAPPDRRRVEHPHHRRGRRTTTAPRRRLTPSELDQFFLILAIAGSETTRSAISGGLVAFRSTTPSSWPGSGPSRRCSTRRSRRSSAG